MRVTASSLPLLAACQYWARPDVKGQPFVPTAEMLDGTATHAAVEAVLAGEPVPELPTDNAADFFATWGAWWQGGGELELRGSLGGTWQPEQAFAYDTATDSARALGRVRGRAYPATADTEVAGTVDALLHDARARAAIVVDWKTGDDRGGYTADASENRQLRGYALAVSRALDVDVVTVAVVRIRTDGSVVVTRQDFDALELGAAADDLRAQLAAVPTAHPVPGSHCRRCRAVASCPATAAATDQLAPRDAPPEPVQLVVTRDNAAALLVRLRAVQAACDHVEQALRAFAAENDGIALDNGKTWRKVAVERQSVKLDGPEAAAALAVLDVHGVGDAVERKLSTSKAALERVLKASGLKGKELAARVQAVVRELEAAGAVRSTTVETFKEC